MLFVKILLTHDVNRGITFIMCWQDNSASSIAWFVLEIDTPRMRILDEPDHVEYDAGGRMWCLSP